MIKKFRYQESMNNLSISCPPSECEPRETIAFRWVFEHIEDEKNFLPQFFKNPNYANAREDVQCQSLGLSCFVSEQQARQKFEKYLNRIGPTAYKVLGEKVAKGFLNSFDGHCSLSDSSGHFTFHPFDDSIFERNFVLISAL